jgi:hypothetical protein
MAFTIKHRPASGAPMMAEYLCPEHGRFEQLVARDEKGDPPATHVCAQSLFVDSATDCCEDHAGTCPEVCPLVIGASKGKADSMPARAVTRGGDMKERPPGMLDTRPLAEGMPMSEWKKLQKKQADERRHHKLIERGLKTKRVQV